jgi:hypothetical protein
MKSEREVIIDTYIKDHPDAKQEGAEPLVIHGQRKELPVYRLPTKLLVFNIKNGRFAAEALAEERRLKRKLDPTKSEDIIAIQKLLLDRNPEETDALKHDLKKNGQLRNGIITADGAVINANRRLAILKALAEETQEDKFAYITVARLPRGIDEKDLWKIEANLQFGYEFRLEYGPVNELLKIKAGYDSGLTEKQIAEPTSGRYTESDIKEKLRILKLIDSYLSFINQPGGYRLIQEGRHVEKFNSLQSNVVAPLERTWGKKTEIPKIITAAFGLVRGDQTTHWQIRKLKKIAELEPARTALYKAFDKRGKLSSDNKVIKDAFDDAEFILESEEEKDRPEKLAGKALSLLKDIEVKHASVRTKDFQETLRLIKTEVDRLSSSKKKK